MEHKLNLSIVESITIDKWGSEVTLICLDDPVDRNAHTLVFKGCKEVRYLVHDLENVEDPLDDLIGIKLGKDNFQEPAVVTGGIFELWITYKSSDIR